ncbi:MAG: peptidase M75 [Bacteroidales bacterium]|jgi:predicted lipoprotein|nr:peptidase M75 [Bacteroidales bacterium]
MRKISYKKVGLLVMAASLGLGFNSCKDKEVDEEQVFSEILESYVDNTVIATYANLADKALELSDLCQQLKAQPSQAAVDVAAQKWKEARVFWEQSEAFLYGPADFRNLDPHIDSWPLDKNQLDQTLARPDVDNLDATEARATLGVNLLGFHAIEYVLFKDGQPRSYAEIPARELTYCAAVAGVLAEDCILLEASWKGINNISQAKAEILAAADLSITDEYGNQMKNAGKTGSRYSSQKTAINEIIEGCKDIADEVGNSKIQDPVQSGDVLKVESWYSWNSIADFCDNIRSIENAYLGGIPAQRSHSLSSYIASIDKEKKTDLDGEIKSNINNAITKIQAIGSPFRNHLDNKTGANEATDACDELFNSLNKISQHIQ